MGRLDAVKNQAKRLKGTEWAILLLVLGLAGSLLLSSGTQLLGGSPVGEPSAPDVDALEARLSSVLSKMEGAGEVMVVIHYERREKEAVQAVWLESSANEDAGRPISALIIAEGAGDLKVQLELCRAVETLLDLSPDAVEIFKMEGKKE